MKLFKLALLVGAALLGYFVVWPLIKPNISVNFIKAG